MIWSFFPVEYPGSRLLTPSRLSNWYSHKRESNIYDDFHSRWQGWGHAVIFNEAASYERPKS